jgi:hypothetical protein
VLFSKIIIVLENNKKPLLKPTPLGDLKSVIEMVSPVLTVNEYPF